MYDTKSTKLLCRIKLQNCSPQKSNVPQERKITALARCIKFNAPLLADVTIHINIYKFQYIRYRL